MYLLPCICIYLSHCCRHVYKTDNFHSIVALVSCHNMFLMIMNHPLSVGFFVVVGAVAVVIVCCCLFVHSTIFNEMRNEPAKDVLSKVKMNFQFFYNFSHHVKSMIHTGCTLVYTECCMTVRTYIRFSFWHFHNRIYATHSIHSAIIQEGIESKKE